MAEFVSQQKVLWNFDWEFSLGTEQKDWRHVDLPHDFQFEQPWTENGSKARGFKPMCEGWYRKTFVADEAWKGLSVKLDFGGIIYYGDVRARGGFEVSMRWQKGKVVETTIKNCGPKASEVTIKYNGQQQTIHMNIGETKKI